MFAAAVAAVPHRSVVVATAHEHEERLVVPPGQRRRGGRMSDHLCELEEHAAVAAVRSMAALFAVERVEPALLLTVLVQSNPEFLVDGFAHLSRGSCYAKAGFGDPTGPAQLEC